VSFDLTSAIEQKMVELEQSIRFLRTHGDKLALAEKEYKMCLTQKALELRESGMAVTLIDTVIYGLKEVALKRYERDLAKTMYEANLEHINATKLQLRLLEAQISREWSHPSA
jgi:hypothetical protein